MPLLPIHPPRLGLSISAQHIALAELIPGWRPMRRRITLRRVRERLLPSGLLSPSDTGQNITDVKAVAAELRALVERPGVTPVTLSLPDHCAQIALFDFETLPRRVPECEALLRWRFHEEWNLPRGETRIAFQVFRCPDGFAPSRERPGPAVRILAVSIRRDILRQYERACEEAGLLPAAIGLSTCQLFDLCRRVMRPSNEVFFVNQTTDGFSFLAVRQGCPAYLRIKRLRQDSAGLSQELMGTLQFYDEQQVLGSTDPDVPRVLYVVGTGAEPIQPAGEATEPSLQYSTSKGSRSVSVVQFRWADLAVTTNGGVDPPVSGLSALAGLVAA